MEEIKPSSFSTDVLEELEVVASSLARTPRLEQLLRYLAARYFAGESSELTEYNIATEVFGRKKTEFVASQDAIARVETHRLRKKLTAFYEGPGRDHRIQISIPAGTYVPHFADRTLSVRRASGGGGLAVLHGSTAGAAVAVAEAEAADELDAMVRETHEPAEPPRSVAIPSRWLWLTVAAVLLVALGIAAIATPRWRPAAWRRSPVAAEGAATGGAATATGAAAARGKPGMATAPVPLRMIAGYDGAPQRDAMGDAWGPDRYFNGGWARHQSKAFIAGTGNQFLFRYGRDGDMSYTIPLAPGTYELHLYFMQASDTEQSEDAENKTIFDVQLNGQIILNEFDIVSDAMGRNVADERVIRDVSPSSDGKLHLQFSTVLGTPTINAIEIVPGKPHAQLPLRMAMQSTSYTDRSGQLWRPDDYFLGGRSLTHNVPSSGADDDVLPFERYGHFRYALPVDPRDRYTVTLRFVELFFGTPTSDDQDGHRVFRVLCNGQTLLDDFEIRKEAPSFHVLAKTFHHLKPSAQGKLNIDFEPVTNYATVSSIEVVDESQ